MLQFAFSLALVPWPRTWFNHPLQPLRSNAFSSLAEPEAPCPDGWVSWGKSCFFLGQDKLDWVSAEQKCAEVTGSQLASCLTSQEATFLSFKVMADDYYVDYFLGINDL